MTAPEGPRDGHEASREATAALADRLDALLPQTQCRQCQFEGCAPYASAMARGEAEINRCPPGGEATIAALASALNKPPLPLDPTLGKHGALTVALIDEDRCIGCRLCIKACPVDAIVGAPRQMHTVLQSDCTGCELCIAPCPVDCIDMVARPEASDDTALHERLAQWQAMGAPSPLAAPPQRDESTTEKRRARYWRWLHDRHRTRLASGERAAAARTSRRAAREAGQDGPVRPAEDPSRPATHVPGRPELAVDQADRMAVIRAAVERTRARRAERRPAGTPGPGTPGRPGDDEGEG